MSKFISIARILAAVGLALAIFGGPVAAQTTPNTFKASSPGWAAVSNASLDSKGGNYTKFNADGPVVKVWDISTPGGVMATPNVWALPGFTPSTPGGLLWTGTDLGQVFGLALDDDPKGPYIYATTTAIYGTVVCKTTMTNTCTGNVTSGSVTSTAGCSPESNCYPGNATLSVNPATAPGNLLVTTTSPGLFVQGKDATGTKITLYGAVWRLSLKADLSTNNDPNKTYELIATIPNSNMMGLGQIAYNPKVRKFYVSNFNDGRIYAFTNPAIGAMATVYSAYDHGQTAATPAIADDEHLLFTQYGRRIWGLQYNAAEDRLYYAVWNADLRFQDGKPNQIWSVGLDGSGLPVPTTARKEFDMPVYGNSGLPPGGHDSETGGAKYSQPVSDIAFDQSGTVMLVAERGERIGRDIEGGYDVTNLGNSTLPHNSRILRYKKVGANWVRDNLDASGNLDNYGQYAGDVDDDTVGSAFYHSRTNSAGGVDFGYEYTRNPASGYNQALDPAKPDDWGWNTVNSYKTLGKGLVYGFQGAQLSSVPGAGNSVVITPSSADILFVDYDGDTSAAPKSMVGDIEIHRMPATDDNGGILKICKVAGEGVDIDTGFTFGTAIPGTPGSTTTVPAGPGPGGYCKVAGSYAVGSTVSVGETGPAGYTVTGIDVKPPSALSGAPDYTNGQVKVVTGPGVTEVTFTNERHTGYVEICKTGNVAGDFTFAVDGIGNVTVPAGACSPAYQVAAGPLKITEITPGAQMDGCSTLPTSRQAGCDLAGLVSTVTIVPGDISTQTIAYIDNGCIETAAHQCGKTDGGGLPAVKP